MDRLTQAIAIALVLLTTNQHCFGERVAILIGCSKYVSKEITDLPGAANDVSAFKQLLEHELEFQHVTVLSGWSDDEASRPTHDNIVSAFEQLIHSAEPDTQVLILMSGHGTYFPVPDSQTDLLDPANPEPDGLDEAFLPADYASGQNMILDNQIGMWLDQLKSKGTHVWIVFDSCHSGTMTRSASTNEEVARYVSPKVAGVSPEKLKAVKKRAELQAKQNALQSRTSGEIIENIPRGGGTGSVVAFFAAKSHQTEAELIRPRVTGIKRGLLSYHLEQELRERKGAASYDDLGRALISRYQTDGRRKPSPFWTGDLQREVLGLKSWPKQRPLFLNRKGEQMFVSGGQLAGLHAGAMLEVFAPGDKEQTSPLGQVRVLSSNATSANVQRTNSSTDDPWPENCLCQLLSSATDTRIRLDLVALNESGLKPLADERLANLVSKQAVESGYQVDQEAGHSDWALVVLQSSGDALLLPNQELDLLVAADSGSQMLEGVPHARFNADTLADPSKFLDQLTSDVEKIAKWNNLQRLIVAAQSQVRSGNSVSIEAYDTVGNPITNSQLRPGDIVELRATNTNLSRDYWYVIVQLNSNFGIGLVGGETGRGIGTLRHASPNDPPKAQPVYRFRCGDSQPGAFGVVVIALDTRDHPHTPNYSFLRQDRLGSSAKRTVADPASTPFEKLLDATLWSPAQFRSQQGLDKPQILSWTWTISSP
ncbi:caspase family protein [Stieleria sp. TO1_6]|uniref:caspase family protein n=1 Tax=Stieleria tagensis TaxID=2956795 RepID=UPI00209B3909|nr:caspase family protein [Stieleria tagensis]MCO8123346.1 caspase family protein [Stieleria tagensis]